MKIEVRTNEYERAHGKKPRGLGNWAFWMGSDTRDIEKANSFFGTYTEACRQARIKARELGFERVTVGS